MDMYKNFYPYHRQRVRAISLKNKGVQRIYTGTKKKKNKYSFFSQKTCKEIGGFHFRQKEFLGCAITDRGVYINSQRIVIFVFVIDSSFDYKVENIS